MALRAKKQHFVPRFLLRNFAFNKNSQLYAFDKHTDREFVVSVGDAASKSGFYEFDLKEKTVSLESALASLENVASVVIQKIVSSESLTDLTAADRVILALFICVQQSRSLNWRSMQADLNEQIRQKLQRIADERNSRLEADFFDENVEDFVALMGISTAREFVPIILEKPWVLQRVSGSSLLHISDSPMTLHNMNDFGPYGNLGFAVPGVELQLPLSSTLNLWIICPTLYAKFEEGYKTAFNLKQRHGKSSPLIDSMIDRVELIRDGLPVVISEENVMHYNSLQVMFSDRFVYSSDGNFKLVKRMISDNERYRRGIRFLTENLIGVRSTRAVAQMAKMKAKKGEYPVK